MARKSRTAVLKREKRELRQSESSGEPRVATAEELEGYGFPVEREEPNRR